jgi:hypothetical protein
MSDILPLKRARCVHFKGSRGVPRDDDNHKLRLVRRKVRGGLLGHQGKVGLVI